MPCFVVWWFPRFGGKGHLQGMEPQQGEQTEQDVFPFPMPAEGKEVEGAECRHHFMLECLAVALAEKQTKGVNGEVIQLVLGALYVGIMLDAADDGQDVTKPLLLLRMVCGRGDGAGMQDIVIYCAWCSHEG